MKKHGKICEGDVVVVSFSFFDLSATKRRPALVLVSLAGDDYILCQITSEARKDEYVIVLENRDFKIGSLNKVSMIRPNKLFTADSSIISYKVGALKEDKIKEIEEKIIKMFKT